MGVQQGGIELSNGQKMRMPGCYEPGPFGCDDGPVVSVVVPVFGFDDRVKECLQSLVDCADVPTEIVVVNDKPGDRVEVPKVARLVVNDENLGFAGACNAGAEASCGRFLAFVNSDVVVTKGWDRELLRTAGNLAASVVGCKLMYADKRVQHGGMFWNEADGVYTIRKREGATGHVEVVCGACMLVERDMFVEVGGFGREFGVGYFEDVDLCLRVIERGGRVAYTNDVEVYHKELHSFRRLDWESLVVKNAATFRELWPAHRREKALDGYPFRNRVDIIVAVHNALRSTVDCIDSINDRTARWIDWRLIVVDDASDEQVGEHLKRLTEQGRIDVLLRNEENVGYLPSIQKATEQSNAPLICYVNSDVVVTEGWLSRMIHAMEVVPNVAVVNPYTNCAAHQSVKPPKGSNHCDMAERLNACSQRRYFDVVTPVGFCMLVDREVMDAVGGYDVEYYGRGYGEECDLYMRLHEAGWRSVMADDAYVLHEGGKTFGQFGSQQAQEHAGYQKFMSRWGRKATPLLASYNKRSPQRYIENPSSCYTTDGRPHVCFVFRTVSMCGGVLAVVHIANRLIELGWNAYFSSTHVEGGDETLDRLGARFTPLTTGDPSNTINKLANVLPHGAVVVATIWATAHEVAELKKRRPDVRVVYFIQDVEYMFTYKNGRKYTSDENVIETYGMIPNRVVNSDWVLDTVRSHGYEGHKIGIGVDPFTFYPRDAGSPKPDRPTIMAHCRPSTPRRGWPFIRDVLCEVKRSIPHARVVVYDEQPQGFTNVEYIGKVSPEQLARHMRQADVFLEGSKYQGWGMQSLEAMATGIGLVSTANRGIDNYGTNGHDCAVVSHGDVDEAANACIHLLLDDTERERLGINARRTAMLFDWNHIAGEWDRYLREVRP